MPDEDEQLIVEVLHALHNALGTLFTRQQYWRAIKPILVSVGRHDLNTGGWIGRGFRHPIHLDPSPVDRAADKLTITARWLDAVGLTDEVLDDEERELNSGACTTTGKDGMNGWIDAWRLPPDRSRCIALRRLVARRPE